MFSGAGVENHSTGILEHARSLSVHLPVVDPRGIVLGSKAGLRLMEASCVKESSGFPLFDGRLWLTSWRGLDQR